MAALPFFHPDIQSTIYGASSACQVRYRVPLNVQYLNAHASSREKCRLRFEGGGRAHKVIPRGLLQARTKILSGLSTQYSTV